MSRWRRARFWVRWARRDARRHRRQVLSIALLLALGVGMYTAMSSMAVWRVESADGSFAALRMHDLRVTLVEGSTAREGALRSALARSGAGGDVAAAAERLAVSTQVDASTRGRSIIVPGRIVGAPAGAQVDTLSVRAGRLPAAPASGRPAVALERNFARHYDLPPSGTLTLAGGRRVASTGQVLAPEYFIVTAPGADFGAESAFAVVFAPLHTAQALAGQPGRVNQLVVRLREGADPAAVRARLSGALRAALPATGFTVVGRDQEPAHRMIYKDAEGDQQMLDVFAFLLLGAATFAAFNLISRTVEAQRRELGIGMALGVAPRQLARRPLLLSAQIALAGVGLGIPVGFAADLWLAGLMQQFVPLPVVHAGFQGDLYLQGAVLGLALPLLAAAVPVWRAVRVVPIEAIRVGASAARSSGLAWLVKGVRLPGGTLANLPLRNVLRTPRRTLMTLLGIGAVVTVVIAMSGVMDSFDSTLTASRQEALAGSAERLTVDLAAPQRAGGAAVRRVAGDAGVGASQTSLRMASTLIAGGRRLDVVLEAIGDDRPLWHPTFERGALPADRPGLLIARSAAEALHVTVGDSVAVLHPVPSGRGTYRLARTALPVTGIHPSPLRFVAYANSAATPALGVSGLVNRISVVPAPGRSADDVKSALLRRPAVAAVQGAAATTDAVDEGLEQFNEILFVTVAIAGAMALLIAFNATAINTDERAREHATMFAYGVSVERVVRSGMLEALLIGALGTAVGIAGGHVVLSWIVNTNMPETMPDVGTLVAVAPLTYVLAAVAGTIVVAAAPLLTLRRLRRTDLSATLRVVE
ncbi:MAG TPA: FtsX-like permease family protein [Solirubrobacteraceae bacterium]|nr:FtsX-like permease family protein [Solirubrobacteraceae bacterium]